MKEKIQPFDLEDVEVFIFDMDGTLYQLDGVDNTIRESSLEKKVFSNSLDFIIRTENCSVEEAEKILSEAKKDEIGISVYLSKRYGITRADYFDIVWNIDPSEIIINFEKSVEVIKELKRQGKRIFLLTAAPGMWMRRVVEGLFEEDQFERKYYGEMFATKVDIFEKIASELDPGTILSIGDQFETDIAPAHVLGMKTLHVKNPNDLLKLI